MRVDGPSKALVGFANYTEKIAADAVNPDKAAASSISNAAVDSRGRADAAVAQSSLKQREAFSVGVSQGRADSIEHSCQADANNLAAEKTRDGLIGSPYSKGSIIDTMA